MELLRKYCGKHFHIFRVKRLSIDAHRKWKLTSFDTTAFDEDRNWKVGVLRRINDHHKELRDQFVPSCNATPATRSSMNVSRVTNTATSALLLRWRRP